jgi:hypothetical protein
MDATSARALAAAKLRELTDPAYPLALDDERGPAERSWCWVFPFNTTAWFTSRHPLDAVLSGPVVVTKDGRDVFVVGTARPVDTLLAEYAATHGYPEH